jgi:hypothetical protein
MLKTLYYEKLHLIYIKVLCAPQFEKEDAYNNTVIWNIPH